MHSELGALSTTQPGLSIVIPVYNERTTIGPMLSVVARALPAITKEIIIVDDCSVDGTRDWLRRNFGESVSNFTGITLAPDGDIEPLWTEGVPIRLRVFYHPQNRGKGAALRTGFAAATGAVVVIQDADLEYDPEDWARMYSLITERQVADVVYGSRFTGVPHRALYFHHFVGNKVISFVFNMLYNQMLTDVEVCYKMFSADVLKSLNLTCDDFGIEIELSAQIARARKWRIYEVGIHYFGRTYSEGKKISWRDGVKALWYLVKFRW